MNHVPFSNTCQTLPHFTVTQGLLVLFPWFFNSSEMLEVSLPSSLPVSFQGEIFNWLKDSLL